MICPVKDCLCATDFKTRNTLSKHVRNHHLEYYEKNMIHTSRGFGRIYKIVHNGETKYIGSTFRPLQSRLWQHCNIVRNSPWGKYAQQHGAELEIESLHEMPDIKKSEMILKEREFISSLKPPYNRLMIKTLAEQFLLSRERNLIRCRNFRQKIDADPIKKEIYKLKNREYAKKYYKKKKDN